MKEAALNAVSLNPLLPEAHVALGVRAVAARLELGGR